MRPAGLTVFTHADPASGIAIDAGSIFGGETPEKPPKRKFPSLGRVGKCRPVILPWFSGADLRRNGAADAETRFDTESIVPGRLRLCRVRAAVGVRRHSLHCCRRRCRFFSFANARSTRLFPLSCALTVYLSRVRYRTHNALHISSSTRNHRRQTLKIPHTMADVVADVT